MKPHIFKDGFTSKPWVCRSHRANGRGGVFYDARRGKTPWAAFYAWHMDFGRFQ